MAPSLFRRVTVGLRNSETSHAGTRCLRSAGPTSLRRREMTLPSALLTAFKGVTWMKCRHGLIESNKNQDEKLLRSGLPLPARTKIEHGNALYVRLNSNE